jgi:hypothetical protein
MHVLLLNMHTSKNITIMALAIGLIMIASNANAELYGNRPDSLYWKHQVPWDKTDGITYLERASCNHKLAYPYVYCAPPCKSKPPVKVVKKVKHFFFF